ncbi:uncharacterized protein CELE_K02B2.6 [Caenorhabditis elegans]|uniref:Uncharacterized protein n=1 Tax=Caenorhabditis elegans TaxID=6239 RepID=Q21124_CAEEL|nr:Uncharacterized protein CELE_K02B2.6 [Caenorhabditis elegans]CCD61805.3 Uncharacterized protein CELE_K02B2.6 [Caenorhabditis elegans]|eukprot:NP_001355374.1 Uncharacterized protein CELE_K02B2.6 [Caenorhabditis elegans]
MYDEKPKDYNDRNIPDKLLPAPIPPPWYDGMDALYLFWEGISRDVVRAILGVKDKINIKTTQVERTRCANALKSSSMPRGTSTMSFLDPIQLKNRSGREVQEANRFARRKFVERQLSCLISQGNNLY